MSLTEPAAPEIIIPTRDGRLSGWTEERTERCRALWKDGNSAGQIAIELGGVTRNAVIGKLMRMGLQRGGPRVPGLRPQARSQKRNVGGHAVKVLAAKERKEFWRIGTLATDLPADVGDNPTPLFDLEDCHCRWPVSGEGYSTLFCGGDAYRDLPYCIRHCRMAYVR